MTYWAASVVLWAPRAGSASWLEGLLPLRESVQRLELEVGLSVVHGSWGLLRAWKGVFCQPPPTMPASSLCSD